MKVKSFSRERRRLFLLAKKEFATFLVSTFGVLIYTLGVSVFVIPYHFPDTGVMGVSLLMKYTLGLSPALVNLAINAVLIFWGAKQLSKRFMAWTIYNTVLTSVLLEILHRFTFPNIDDLFLVAVCAGIVKGIGIGMVFRTGGSTGGLDIIVAVLRKKLGVEVGKYSFYFNLVILAASSAAVGFQKVLFGFIACAICGQTMDDVISSFDKRRLVFIVSSMAKQHSLLKYIAKQFNKGTTVFESCDGSSGEDRSTVMCMLTVRQTMELKRHLAQHYPSAFMVVSEASEVLGTGFKRWKNI